MNTNCLARYYKLLNPRERFALLVAARTRGDAAEAERLAESAPTHTFWVANYRGLVEVMGGLSWLHLTKLLNAAACLWQAEGWLEASGLARSTADDRVREARMLRVVQLWAYLFVIEWDAWERFCTELHLESKALLRDLPGYATVQEAEARARLWAFTAAEAMEAARIMGADAAQVPTVDVVLADLRAALAVGETWWR
jgi:hypothetical protein